MQRLNTLRNHFNWRMLLMRIAVNALALLITAIVVPTINFTQDTLLTWFLLAVLLGIFNAVVKPIIQFATLRFLFATYGLVIVLINGAILLLLAWLFPELIKVGNVLWALVGGTLIAVLSAFLENLHQPGRRSWVRLLFDRGRDHRAAPGMALVARHGA
jgi:putative membrane protein